MINSELGHVKSVEEFNKEIIRQQEEAHGEFYCGIQGALDDVPIRTVTNH